MGRCTSNNGQDLIVTQNNTGSPLTIGSQITSSVALTKAGVGTLILGNSNNTFTGKTYINGGSVQITPPTPDLGAVPGSFIADAITISGGGADSSLARHSICRAIAASR